MRMYYVYMYVCMYVCIYMYVYIMVVMVAHSPDGEVYLVSLTNGQILDKLMKNTKALSFAIEYVKYRAKTGEFEVPVQSEIGRHEISPTYV